MQTQITAFQASQQMSDRFNQALAQDRRFHPNLGGITRGGIANHYPMTVLALQGLGASEQELENFNRNWPRHRAEIEDLGLVDRHEVTLDNWQGYLGQSARLLEFRRMFSDWLTQTSADTVIADALAIMQNSLPMGLFHPLIRLSFAAEHGDQGLIADALAYMAIRYLDLFGPVASVSAPTANAAGIWRQLDSYNRVLPRGGSLSVCEQLCADQDLHQRAGFPQVPAQIIRLALRLYLNEPALTTLHAVTAAQALADLQRRASAEQQPVYAALWQRYWIWLTGLYLEKGRPTQLPDVGSDSSLETLATWDQLAAQARALPEVHLIKMAYSCRWLDRVFGPDLIYRVAVSNMLREGRAHPRGGSGLPAQSL